LQEAVERQKASVFIEAKGLVAEAVALDPSSAAIIRAPEALREALLGIGFSAANMRDEEEIAAIQAAQEQAMQQQQLLNVLGQGADIAKTAGEAAGAFAS
jgi:hypothetical protein